MMTRHTCPNCGQEFAEAVLSERTLTAVEALPWATNAAPQGPEVQARPVSDGAVEAPAAAAFSSDKQETPRADAIALMFSQGDFDKGWAAVRELECELGWERTAKWKLASSVPSARTPIADLSAFMVTHDVDVDFCYPGNHGGPVDEWLVTLTNQSANRVEEFVGRTLDEAITYAVTQYVQQKADK